MDQDPLILIVDDEPVGRSVMQGLLMKEGYRLEFADDGPTALRRARELTPDLILLDVMMPGMDGYAVTREIRATPALAEMPVLLVTALDDAKSRLTGIEAGADDFVTKPFNRLEFRARVRAITRLNRFRRLHHEREKYRLLFEHCPFGLLIIDSALRVLDANRPAQELLVRALGPASADAMLQALPPPEVTRLQHLLLQARADPRAAPRGEFTTREGGRNQVWFELIVSYFPPAGADAYQVTLRDVTAERMLEVDYRHAQKIESMGQLAGGIAHDFNNLLTVINGFSELTLRALPADHVGRKHAQQIRQAGERAAALTRQLLAFSRKQILAPVDLDLNALVRGVESMLHRLIGEDLTVQSRLAPTLGRIRADPGQLEQILINLAVNARDAMAPGGVLTITTDDGPPASAVTGGQASAVNRPVRLIVADTGCGIPPEVLPRLFEPFFTTKEPGKGTGLGLATVHGIVKQSGGAIEVRSEPGQGTQFLMSFPRLKESEAVRKSANSCALVKAGTETVLLAEDDSAVRDIATITLESAGYRVLAARDGEDALRVSRTHEGQIHLLLTDVVMPRLSGRQVAVELHRDRPDLRTLYVSGYTDDAVIRNGVQGMEFSFLQKPYTPGTLLQKVRETLDD